MHFNTTSDFHVINFSSNLFNRLRHSEFIQSFLFCLLVCLFWIPETFRTTNLFVINNDDVSS